MILEKLQYEREDEILRIAFEQDDCDDYEPEEIIPEEMNEYLDNKKEPWWYLAGYGNQAEAYGI